MKPKHNGVIYEVMENIIEDSLALDSILRVAGAIRPCGMLREQFSRIRAAHVEAALWNLRTGQQKILLTSKHTRMPCFTINLSPLTRKFLIKRRGRKINATVSRVEVGFIGVAPHDVLLLCE